MRGWRCVVEDYGKESINEWEISIHTRKASFACTRRPSALLDTQLFALCILWLNVLLKLIMRKV